MKRICMLTMIFMLIFSSMVLAGEWTWLASTDTTGYYVDFSRLYRNNSNGNSYMRYWIKRVFEDISERQYQSHRIHKFYPEFDTSDFYYSVAEEEYISNYKSNSKICRTCAVYFYDTNGRLIGSDTSKGEWHDVVPGSEGESIPMLIIYADFNRKAN